MLTVVGLGKFGMNMSIPEGKALNPKLVVFLKTMM